MRVCGITEPEWTGFVSKPEDPLLRRLPEKVSIEKIPEPCRSCEYWETKEGRGEKLKEKWFIKVLEKFGDCGFIAFSNDKPVGYAQYAPLEYFPNIKEYPSGPVSRDAIFISCLYVFDKRKRGIGTLLLKSIIENLEKRNFEAVETFGRRDSDNNPSGPVEFYLKNGFSIIKEKDKFPLLRKEER